MMLKRIFELTFSSPRLWNQAMLSLITSRNRDSSYTILRLIGSHSTLRPSR